MSAVTIIARLSWLRLLRGKNKWLSLILAALPAVLAANVLIASSEPNQSLWLVPSFLLLQFAVPLAAAAHLAGAVGEELEQKTFSYLWSRPVPRWTLLAGKLLAHLPALIGLFALSCTSIWLIARAGGLDVGVVDLGRLLLGAIGALVAGSALALGAGALFPRYPLAFVLGFGLVLDKLLTLVPAVQPLSASLSAAALAGLPFPEVGAVMPDAFGAVVRLLVNSAIWLGLGIWRVRSAEYALPDA